MTPLNLSVAEPDFDEDHFADCAVQTTDGPCDCPEILAGVRADFADARLDMEKCY